MSRLRRGSEPSFAFGRERNAVFSLVRPAMLLVCPAMHPSPKAGPISCSPRSLIKSTKLYTSRSGSTTLRVQKSTKDDNEIGISDMLHRCSLPLIVSLTGPDITFNILAVPNEPFFLPDVRKLFSLNALCAIKSSKSPR